MACVSCVSATFFQPVRSGSHLYTANRNTLRSVHWELDLLALVGTPLWGCRSLTLCFYYSTLNWICQEVFYIFFERCFYLRFRLAVTLSPVCSLLLTPLLYHKLFSLSTPFLHRRPNDVIFTIRVVFVGATAYKTNLVEFIQITDNGKAVDSQVHRNLTQAETVGIFTQNFKNFVFHSYYLSFFCAFIIAHSG